VSRELDRLLGNAPGSGPVAALVATIAAELVATVARRSSETWPEAAGAAAQAEALRRRAAPLCEADARAYLKATEQIGAGDDFELGRAMARAAEVPLAIAAVAADVAALAKEAAERGDLSVRADAVGAALLAEAAARAAAHLVEINLGTSAEDLRVLDARALAATAAAYAEAAAGAE
jgi:formiminotetrahydrofolate cyclodeaminase